MIKGTSTSRFALSVIIAGLALCTSPCLGISQTTPITGISELVSMPVSDCDGVAIGDIDRDGSIDLLTSSGGNGTVLWFEQGEGPADWQRHRIYDDAAEVEGNELVDVDGNGRLEAFSLDQETGTILLHRPADDPQGNWDTVPIQSGRPFLQASLTTDLDEDGQPELVYTWEGTKAGTGGVHWLDYQEGSVQDPDSWTDHTMRVHESAWWLVPRPMDLNGDGAAREIIYTARNKENRNPGSTPGLFWIETGSNPAVQWHRHVIDTTLSHPLHVDAGHLSPEGTPPAQESEDRGGPDLVVGGFETETLSYYARSNSSWRRHDLDTPVLDGHSFGEIWNVKALPWPGHRQDAMLGVFSQSSKSAMVLYAPRDGQYQHQVLNQMSYTHPLDDRLVLRDLTGDDRPEMIVPDSGGGKLSIYQFEWSD